MPTAKNISNLVINNIENQEVYDWMDEQGLVNPDELYFIGGDKEEGARIITGSYTGTGTYGDSNPVSLTFEFSPKFLVVYTQSDNNSGYAEIGFMVRGSSYGFYGNIRDSESNRFELAWGDNSISWYNIYNSTRQFNVNNIEYYYVAIG